MTATTAAKPLGFAMPVKTAKAKRYPWIIEAAFQRENLPGVRVRHAPVQKIRARHRAPSSYDHSVSSSSYSSLSPVFPPLCLMPSASKAWPFSTIHSMSE